MDFWSTFAGVYDVAEALNGGVYREMTSITAGLVPRGAEVLDCAAGTGELSLAAAQKARHVVCTDYSGEMLNVARKKAKKRGLVNVEFERANIFHLGFADGTFDAVIAGNVLHLLENPENAVRELCRVAKSGGKILLPTFMSKSGTAISAALLKAYKRLGFSPCAEYSPREYVEMLKGCNVGGVKSKLIKGNIPCCYAVIIKY
ncbi:MAG: class I SAM-dependent methyltransferase [Lachnospiraceae bacterium]|nr:class I SAM-dependent methyltransferase [Ruminococcus sp.]MCM1277164.1 class I SAM-dependent methyltransferase [Lachnospiraceae bacterium]